MAKSLCLPSKACPKLCISGTKGRAALTQSVTSLAHAFDRFISLYLHVLTLTKEESSCHSSHCCKEKKGLDSWVKQTKPYDLHVSGHVPGCISGAEHVPCVWEELCSRCPPCTSLTLSDCTNKNLPFHGSIVQAWTPPQPPRQNKSLCQETTEVHGQVSTMNGGGCETTGQVWSYTSLIVSWDSLQLACLLHLIPLCQETFLEIYSSWMLSDLCKPGGMRGPKKDEGFIHSFLLFLAVSTFIFEIFFYWNIETTLKKKTTKKPAVHIPVLSRF